MAACAVACALPVVAAAALPSSARAANGVLFGIEQNGGMQDAGQRAETLDRMHVAGARVARLNLNFEQMGVCDPATRRVAATSPTNPCYDFSTSDAVVREAAARGMRVLFSVYGVPRWVNGSGFSDTGTTDAQFARFVATYADFLQAAVTRYAGGSGLPRVDMWTIWNEPNGAYFWMPRTIGGQMVVPQRYAQLYDVAARRVKQVDPTLLVAGGPTAPTPPDLKPITFLEGALPEIQRRGSPIDAWAHNAYSGARGPFDRAVRSPVVGLGNIEDLAAVLDRFPVTRRKSIWITEFAYETPPAVQASVPVEQQAKWLSEASYRAWSNPRIAVFIWYALMDDGAHDRAVSGFQSGLYYRLWLCGQKWCPKPSAAEFARPIWVSTESAIAGQAVRVWAQQRVGYRPTKLFVNDGRRWRVVAGTRRHADGSIVATLRPARAISVKACDTVCSAVRRISVTAPLPLDAALRNGLRYTVRCRTSCSVSSQLLAARGIARKLGLGRRGAVVARGSGARARPGTQIVLLSFSRRARTALARRRIVELTLQTRAIGEGGISQVERQPVVLARSARRRR